MTSESGADAWPHSPKISANSLLCAATAEKHWCTGYALTQAESLEEVRYCFHYERKPYSLFKRHLRDIVLRSLQQCQPISECQSESWLLYSDPISYKMCPWRQWMMALVLGPLPLMLGKKMEFLIAVVIWRVRHWAEELNRIGIYRTFYPTDTEYFLFSSVHGTFSRIDHIIGHRRSLSQLLKCQNHTIHLLRQSCNETGN